MHPFKVFRSAEYAIVGIRSFPFFPRTFHLFPQKKKKEKKKKSPVTHSGPPHEAAGAISSADSARSQHGPSIGSLAIFSARNNASSDRRLADRSNRSKKKTTSVSSASSLSTYPHTTHLTFDALVPKVNFSVHRRTRSARSCTISAGEQSQLTVVYFLAWIVPAHVAPTCNTFGAERFLINGQNGRTFPLQTKRATDAGRNKVKTFPPTGE